MSFARSSLPGCAKTPEMPLPSDSALSTSFLMLPMSPGLLPELHTVYTNTHQAQASWQTLQSAQPNVPTHSSCIRFCFSLRRFLSPTFIINMRLYAYYPFCVEFLELGSSSSIMR